MISLLGDWAGRLALAVLVLERTDSPAWAAAVTTVSLAGFVGIGQVLATTADRFGRVQVMVVADVVRALCFVAMVAPLPVGALLGLAFVAGLASPPFEAARAAALPDLVPERSYGDALALSGICVQISVVAGYGLGGVLLAVMSPRSALGLDATTFVVSAILVASLRRSAAGRGSLTQTARVSLRRAAATLRGDVFLRRAMILLGTTSLLGIVPEALVAPYADRVGAGPTATGLLAAAVPAGTVVATLVVPRAGSPSRLLRGGSLGAASAALAAPALWMEVTVAPALAVFALSGAVFCAAVPANVVLGTRLDREVRASAMGIALGLVMGLQALGAVLGGLAASAWGVGPSAAVSLLAAGMACLWLASTTPPDAAHRRRAAGHELVDLTEAGGQAHFDRPASSTDDPEPEIPAAPQAGIGSGAIRASEATAR